MWDLVFKKKTFLSDFVALSDAEINIYIKGNVKFLDEYPELSQIFENKNKETLCFPELIGKTFYHFYFFFFYLMSFEKNILLYYLTDLAQFEFRYLRDKLP